METEGTMPLDSPKTYSPSRYFSYKGEKYQVFNDLRFGRFRLFFGAIPSKLKEVTDAWQNETLQDSFRVRQFSDVLPGEEVLDFDGRVIAVFGRYINCAFVPSTKHQEDYMRGFEAACRTASQNDSDETVD